MSPPPLNENERYKLCAKCGKTELWHCVVEHDDDDECYMMHHDFVAWEKGISHIHVFQNGFCLYCNKERRDDD